MNRIQGRGDLEVIHPRLLPFWQYGLCRLLQAVCLNATIWAGGLYTRLGWEVDRLTKSERRKTENEEATPAETKNNCCSQRKLVRMYSTLLGPRGSELQWSIWLRWSFVCMRAMNAALPPLPLRPSSFSLNHTIDNYLNSSGLFLHQSIENRKKLNEPIT